MEKQFDLVVIGTGSAGSTAAYQCARAGWKVAIVDSLPFGGTCALRGCDPKKVLVGGADVVDWLRRMQGNGLWFKDARINWKDLITFKRSFTDPVPENRLQKFKEAGIIAFSGPAQFADPGTIAVDNALIHSKFILIATGAKPVRLNIPGEEYLSTSDDFLELEVLPKEIVFVGGGYIAFEFAHIAARAGSIVTIIHRGSRPLERFDSDLVNRLVRATETLGIRMELNAEVQAIQKTNAGFTVVANQHSVEGRFSCGLVVHGAGRSPAFHELNLEKGKVEYSSGKLKLNQFLQSVSNSAVYAAGDAAAVGPPLTPVAGRDGQIVADNMLRGNRSKADYTAVPSVVFTIPPLAYVGLTEAQARERKLDFEVKHQDTSDWYSSRRINEKHSAFKVLIEPSSGKILGAHIFGQNSEEFINLFALAIRYGLTASMLKDAYYAYPTNASNVLYML